MLGRAHALLADAAVAISSDTSGPAATEALRETLAIGGQLDLITCLLTERVDRTGAFAADGAVSITAWLRNEAHSTRLWASQRVLAGRALADALPATRAAWTAGDLTFEHVGVIRRAIDGLDTTQAGYLDRALAAAAANCSPTNCVTSPPSCWKRSPPTSGKRTATAKPPANASTCPTSPTAAGSTATSTPNPPPSSAPPSTDSCHQNRPPVTTSPGRRSRTGELSPWSKWPAKHWPSTPAIPAGPTNPTSSSPSPPNSYATNSASALNDGGTLPASTLGRMACDAKITPLLLGSDGLPLDVGRTMRTAPSWMRTALNIRDKGCRHPDCDQPPSACEAHHVPHSIDGGKTSLDTMILLCDAHHRRHHKGEFTVTSHGKQRFTITKIPIHQRT